MLKSPIKYGFHELFLKQQLKQNDAKMTDKWETKVRLNLIIIPSKVWYNAVLYQLPDYQLLHTVIYIQV